MTPLPTPKSYLEQMMALTSGEAKRAWRKAIKERDGNRCVYCGSNDNLTLDHIRPKAHGGIDVARNLVTCCLDCNGKKSNKHWQEWYSAQAFFNLTNFTRILNIQGA